MSTTEYPVSTTRPSSPSRTCRTGAGGRAEARVLQHTACVPRAAPTADTQRRITAHCNAAGSSKPALSPKRRREPSAQQYCGAQDVHETRSTSAPIAHVHAKGIRTDHRRRHGHGHTDTHARMHARTHARTWVHTDTHGHTRAHARTHARHLYTYLPTCACHAAQAVEINRAAWDTHPDVGASRWASMADRAALIFTACVSAKFVRREGGPIKPAGNVSPPGAVPNLQPLVRVGSVSRLAYPATLRDVCRCSPPPRAVARSRQQAF